MANFDITAGLVDLNFQTQGDGCIKRVVDFAKFTTAGVAGAAADTADIIDVPANYMVDEVLYEVLVPSSTASSVFGVGDVADSTFYYPNTISATATAGTLNKTVATATASKFKTNTSTSTVVDSSSKIYTAASKIRVVLGATAPLNGKVKIVVVGRYIG